MENENQETELSYRGVMSPQTREAFKRKKEITDMPQEREMIVCAELLLEHEKDLVKTTAMFAVESKEGNVFFVQPSALIPKSFRIVRSSGSPESGGGKPLGFGAVGGGLL